MQAQGAIIRETGVLERPFATSVGLGMVLFLTSEGFLFGTLFIIYFYLRAHSVPNWPPDGVEVHLLTGAINTVVLLSSSITLARGIVAIRNGRSSSLVSWLVATIVLGAVFLIIKLYEWSTNGFAPSDHAYASIYYTLTGFHGLHVLGGIGILTALLLRARRGLFSAQHHLAVEVGARYWHFVDFIWMLVFITIYLGR